MLIICEHAPSSKIGYQQATLCIQISVYFKITTKIIMLLLCRQRVKLQKKMAFRKGLRHILVKEKRLLDYESYDQVQIPEQCFRQVVFILLTGICLQSVFTTIPVELNSWIHSKFTIYFECREEWEFE